MNESTGTSVAFVIGACILFGPGDVVAQTCAKPQHVFANSTISGDTCGANALPELNHGTILTPGDERVFKVSGTYGVTALILHSAADMYVFVCSGCSVDAECVASAESVFNEFAIAPYPQDGGDYYVIVDSKNAGCSDFDLTVRGPLSNDP
jgi:hypothetical protein